MATRSYTFNGGSAGNTVTTSDTGSGDAFDLVSLGSAGDVRYNVAAAAVGALGGRFDAGATGDVVLCRWQVTEANSTYFRAYCQFPSARPSVTKTVYRATCSNSSLKAAMRFSAAGKVVLVDAGSVVRYTSTKAFSAAERFRVEVHFVNSNTTGHMQARLFYGANLNGTTPDESIGNLTDNWDTQGNATGTDFIEFGWLATTTNELLDFDEVAWSTVDWIGPATTPASTTITQVTEADTAQSVTVSKVGVYQTPQPNTDPNNFGTPDQTLDNSMSAATIQSKIDLAGVGGVVFWSGAGASYTINTDLRFLSGQVHYGTQGNPPKVKCTNTGNIASFINLRAPKGGGPASKNVTISDIEFWGHTNVPNRPPTTAPKKVIIPYTGTFLRRVAVKGAAENGIGGQGDRLELGVMIDTCEIAYNVDSTVDNGQDSGLKLTEYGVKNSVPGSTCTVKCTEVHHNWSDGLWWDIGSAGVLLLNNNVHDNSRYGIHWEVSIGPVYMRDNTSINNGDDGIHIVSSARGECYNNILGGNAPGNGIGMLDDGYPDTRNDLTWASGQLAQAGQNQGYQFDLWQVKGNVLNGDTAKYRAIDSNNNTTTNVNLSTDPRPGIIFYSTSFVENAVATELETDSAQAVTSLKTKIINQVLESDEMLAVIPPRPPLTLTIAQVFETDLPQAVVHTPLGVLLNQVVESDEVLPFAALQKVLTISQVAEESDESIGVANPGLTPIRALAVTGVAAARSAIGRLAARATTGSRVAFTTVGRLSTNKSAAGALVPRTAASSLLTYSTTGALRAVATTANFTIKRAEDAVITFTLNSTDGTTPQNITGWTLAFRAGSSQYGAATITKTPTITNAAQGIFTVTLASTDTSSLTQDGADTVYFYDVRRTDSGSRAELFEGTLTVQDTFTNG